MRRREIAVRTAIGAGRGRVVRQLLTETTLLFALGGIAGLLLARALTSLLVTLLPAFPLPVNVSVPLDGRVVAFSLGVSFVAALLCGLVPALHASKPDVVSALKDDAPAPTDRLRLRNTFVVAQVAFSVRAGDHGGHPGARCRSRDVGRIVVSIRDQVDVASVNLSMAGYTAATGSAFARQLIERVRAIPGVEAAIAERSTARSRFDDDGRTHRSRCLAAARTAVLLPELERRRFAVLRNAQNPVARRARLH